MANVRIPNLFYPRGASRLVEGVGAGSPVGEEQAEADGLQYTGNSADGDGVHGTLLGDNLGDDLAVMLAYSDGTRLIEGHQGLRGNGP
jgi:hypothetical protein